jgi:hypothetical protein
MIVVKATHVVFERDDRTKLTIPASYGMLHDPEGESRPKCEVYFAPYTILRREPPTLSAAARRYLGANYDARLARTDLPIAGWSEVGMVRTIWYKRNGERGVARPREDFVHPFRTVIPFWRKSLLLEKSGRAYRLSLGAFCSIDDRGFVFP